MRKALISALLVTAIFIAATAPAYAGGDKVRGESGQGSVNQEQVQDPPPFQP